MYTIQTKIRAGLAKPTEEQLARAFGQGYRYLEVSKHCEKICKNWETIIVDDESEEKVVEELLQFVNLPTPTIIENMINRKVFYGETVDRQYSDFLKILDSIKYCEAELISMEVPLNGEDGEYDLLEAKLRRICGELSIILLNIIRPSDILSSSEKGEMAVPACLDIYLSSKGGYTEEDIKTLIKTLEEYVAESGVELLVFDGYEQLKEEFYSLISDVVISAVESKEELLNIQDVQDFVDNKIDETELLATIGIDAKEYDL